LRVGDHVSPQRTRLHPRSSGFWIDPHALHALGVDQDASVAGSGDSVSGGQHPHTEPFIAG
jgi:hypothetical protein